MPWQIRGFDSRRPLGEGLTPCKSECGFESQQVATFRRLWMYLNGRELVFQTRYAGSIPVIRSIRASNSPEGDKIPARTCQAELLEIDVHNLLKDIPHFSGLAQYGRALLSYGSGFRFESETRYKDLWF